MRILHIITSLHTGGAEKLMVDLLPRLRDAGNEVELVVFDGTRTPFYQQLVAAGIPVHSLSDGGSVYNPKFIFALKRFLVGFDIVHTHNSSAQFFTAIACSLLREKKPVLVTTEHNSTNRRRNLPFFRMIDGWMYRNYQSIICISEQTRLNLCSYLRQLQPKVTTIFNGVDTERFMSPSRTSCKNPERIVVSMVAAFRAQKDQKTLIQAISLLPKNVVLQLVGHGEERLVRECTTLAESLSVNDRVHFLGVRTDVPQILADSDIVVLSSHYEGLSLSSIEGMASGRPFVATDVDGLHEIVNGYGLLVKHEDVKDLAEKIQWLIDNPAEATKLAAKCQQRACQYDIKLMAQNYLNLYQDIIS